MELQEVPVQDSSGVVDSIVASGAGVYCSRDGTITERSRSGEYVREIAKHGKDSVKCMIVVSGKGLKLWAGMSSGYVKIYCIEEGDTSGTLRAECLGHSGAVTCMIVHGRRVYTGSTDKCVFEWHADSMEILRALPCQKGVLRRLTAIGMVLLTCDNTETSIRCWNLGTCKSAGKLVGHRTLVKVMMYHVLTAVLWTGSEDGNIMLWDLTEQRSMTTLKNHTQSVTAITQTASGFIVSGGLDSLMCVWACSAPGTPTCLRQVTISSILHIVPVVDEDTDVLLWVVRKRLGVRGYELTGACASVTPMTRALQRDADREKTKKRSGSERRSRGQSPRARGPSGNSLSRSSTNTTVRQRSPAPPKRMVSPSPSGRKPTTGQTKAKSEELHSLLEENKILRRQLLTVQSEALQEKKKTAAQLQAAADRERVLTRTIHQTSSNIADMASLLKHLIIKRPDIKADLHEVLALILDTNKKAARGVSGNSPSPVRGASPLRARSPRSPRRKKTDLTAVDNRMPMKRGDWGSPTSSDSANARMRDTYFENLAHTSSSLPSPPTLDVSSDRHGTSPGKLVLDVHEPSTMPSPEVGSSPSQSLPRQVSKFSVSTSPDSHPQKSPELPTRQRSLVNVKSPKQEDFFWCEEEPRDTDAINLASMLDEAQSDPSPNSRKSSTFSQFELSDSNIHAAPGKW